MPHGVQLPRPSERVGRAAGPGVWAVILVSACSAGDAGNGVEAGGAPGQGGGAGAVHVEAAEAGGAPAERESSSATPPPIADSSDADDDTGPNAEDAAPDLGRAAQVEASAADARRDANVIDAPAPQGDAAPRPSCGAALCEDFESGNLDPAVWIARANRGQTVTVQSDLAAHGRYAARFHALPDVVSYDFIATKSAPSSLRGHHYGRAYFQVTPRPPAQHMELLYAGTTGFPNLSYLEVATIGEAWQLTFVKQIAPTGETYKPGAGSVPLARWSCLQWEMNDTPDHIALSVDGAAPIVFDPIAFGGTSTGLVGGFGELGFGYYIWHPVAYAFDVYYDDIALDPAPIACLDR